RGASMGSPGPNLSVIIKGCKRPRSNSVEFYHYPIPISIASIYPSLGLLYKFLDSHTSKHENLVRNFMQKATQRQNLALNERSQRFALSRLKPSV
ncbi:MAG: hypothetical protein V1822_03280, partial [Candidatus Micrarchaeota archaeon]